MQADTQLRPQRRNKVFQQATCAAILAASFAAPLGADTQQVMQGATTASLLAGSCLALKASAIQTLQKYCFTSWRQAGIPPQDWDDCTQDVIVELMARMPGPSIGPAIEDPSCSERRELVRSIWCVTQRWRRARARQPVSLDQLAETETPEYRDGVDSWESLQQALQSLNPTQQQILESLRQGESIAEIADELNVPAARVSDQKYKAVKKLQKALAI